jgi:hypothetical protein
MSFPAERSAGRSMRVVIETVDSVREVNRWELVDVDGLIPDWNQLSQAERDDRVAELVGDGAEFCKNLEADTLEREILTIEVVDGR